MTEKGLLLEQIYKEARDECLLGRPLIELPAAEVMSDAKGRVFIDLRLVIDQMQLFLAKAEPQAKE